MAFVYEKWFDFPESVRYGESGILLVLDEDFMDYRGSGVENGMRIRLELFINSPELFERVGSRIVRKKAQMSRSGGPGSPGKIIGWVDQIKKRQVKSKWVIK